MHSANNSVRQVCTSNRLQLRLIQLLPKLQTTACRIALTITAPKAKDNCDKDIVGTAVLPSTFGLGDTTITWKFADNAGNATTCVPKSSR
jgi:hypothetical protein